MRLLKITGHELTPVLEEAQPAVSLEEWQADPAAHEGANALIIPNDVDVETLGDLSGFSVLVLQFPGFKDGRAYSQARIIRERLGYGGELRASGSVVRDQLLFMRRCGFTTFEVDDANVDGALEEFSLFYQTSADKAEPVWRQRARRAAAA